MALFLLRQSASRLSTKKVLRTMPGGPKSLSLNRRKLRRLATPDTISRIFDRLCKDFGGMPPDGFVFVRLRWDELASQIVWDVTPALKEWEFRQLLEEAAKELPLPPPPH
jgi:hypothetical protein